MKGQERVLWIVSKGEGGGGGRNVALKSRKISIFLASSLVEIGPV